MTSREARAGASIRVLTFSTLYPNAVQTAHGVFVENRLRHLVKEGTVESRVVAPVPWFPFSHRMFGSYAAFAGVPAFEEREGLEVSHPRYPVIPKIGMSSAAAWLYLATRRAARRAIDSWGGIDLIDAHYFYPDGVAAALLGRELKKPVVITARGSDVTQIPRHAVPRRQILWAAQRASGIITVCNALKEGLVSLGGDGAKIRVLRNGVDLEAFQPLPPETARRRYGADGPVVLSVGLLIPRKRHDLAIGALPDLPGATLLIAGEGPERNRLESLARRLGVWDRVRFLGLVPHAELAALYGAADVTVLASEREGWANVLLESMACGTPVVASNIPGTDEVVAAPEAGRLFEPHTSDALARAVRVVLGNPPDRRQTRAYAERFGWDATTAGQIALFREVLGRQVPHHEPETGVRGAWSACNS